MHVNARKIAVIATAGALGLALIGAGVGASFSDMATATQNVSTGTFGCTIDSSTPGAVVAADARSVTYDAPGIMSSKAGTSPFVFTVTSTGNIPTDVSVFGTVPDAPFTSLLPDSLDTLSPALGLTKTYNAGLQWPELSNTDLGKTISITYYAFCDEPVTPPTALGSGYATDRTMTGPAFPNGHPANHPNVSPYWGGTWNYSVFQCDYVVNSGGNLAFTKVEAPGPQTNAAPGAVTQWPAGNTVGSKAYVLAFNDGQAMPPASACPAASTIQ